MSSRVYNGGMLKYIVIAILVVCAWMYYGKQKAADAQKKAEAEATRAAQAYQNDVKRAEDAAEKANALIRQQEADVKKGLAHAEEQ